MGTDSKYNPSLEEIERMCKQIRKDRVHRQTKNVTSNEVTRRDYVKKTYIISLRNGSKL